MEPMSTIALVITAVFTAVLAIATIYAIVHDNSDKKE